MSHSEISKRLSAAETELEHAIEALIALDSGPAYLEPLASAANLLAGISPDRIPPAARVGFAEKAKLLSARIGQAEALLESAGALCFGSFLNHTRTGSGYTAEGNVECVAENAFRIDG
jgi:hypothetical protein